MNENSLDVGSRKEKRKQGALISSPCPREREANTARG
jgi:hypothetical protein